MKLSVTKSIFLGLAVTLFSVSVNSVASACVEKHEAPVPPIPSDDNNASLNPTLFFPEWSKIVEAHRAPRLRFEPAEPRDELRRLPRNFPEVLPQG